MDERESERRGGMEENEECRYESSAGEKGREVLAAAGMVPQRCVTQKTQKTTGQRALLFRRGRVFDELDGRR